MGLVLYGKGDSDWGIEGLFPTMRIPLALLLAPHVQISFAYNPSFSNSIWGIRTFVLALTN